MKRRDALIMLGVLSTTKFSAAQRINAKGRSIKVTKHYTYPSFALDREVVIFNTRQGKFEKFTLKRVKLKFVVDHWQVNGERS